MSATTSRPQTTASLGKPGPTDDRLIKPGIRNEIDTLPHSLISYVRRTGEAVIIADASSESLFAADPYVARTHPKSVLCVPILRQGKVVGIFYLENNLATHVFSSERVAFVELLAG